RLWVIENDIITQALEAQVDPDISERRRTGLAFKALNSEGDLALLHRYETRLHMVHQRALHNLLFLRTNMPNEPKPPSDDDIPPELTPYLPGLPEPSPAASPAPASPAGAPPAPDKSRPAASAPAVPAAQDSSRVQPPLDCPH